MESGKKIAQIYFGNGDKLVAKAGSTILEITNEGHGTYDTVWIVQKNGEGVEVARHNPDYVESILWGEGDD